LQLVGCGLREAARESDVADAGPYHVCVAYGGLRDEAALDCEVERGLTARALDLDGDRLAFGAANGLGDFRRRPIARVTSVNLDDAVAEAQSRLRRGRPLNRRLHVDAVAVSKDGDAYPGEARLLILHEPTVFFGVEVVRVR